ncbi:glycosyltransferase family 4 protein [Pseudanabaena sp. ABRG5-3]|jgi:glycosyltransferase involved in cell wall biosynthesis|uniref:glycosyltransferase family 4 protein n=1 Tax=Pseudanabaena sp. ABRG5-3 TaxID=685565 RepID=UPI000DC6E85F|nr:glycosyltransferase family 4 protein [Pseudanabaena sp. ABRG5-3]BBC24964.1 group 1 glycosyl transferase [Pseudanabaena sp. ABRG5-3]
MRILALAWEFPPRIIGGISRHVAELYPEVVKRGHEVHLITVAVENEPLEAIINGIHVHRVPVEKNHDFFEWVVQMNCNMLKFARDFLTARKFLDQQSIDIIHAHDWLVEETAIALTTEFQIPLVATIHATEYGRCNGIHNDTQRYIHQREIRLTQAAKRVIVCSEYMRGELQRALDCPAIKTDVVYNGLSIERWQNIIDAHQLEFDRLALREQYAKPEEAIIYYVGRITFEKGIYVLLNAMPKVIAAMNDQVRLVIIGTGDAYSILLQRQAWDLGIYHKVLFTGFMADADFWKFQTIANCAVFPSLYEPFGIVALESFAAKIPLVVSNTGGLSEVVRHRVTGCVTQVNDANSLAEGIIEILRNQEYAQTLVNNAQSELRERFAWDRLAAQTEEVFLKVLEH